jgi:ketosteroid isomerase-like protein
VIEESHILGDRAMKTHLLAIVSSVSITAAAAASDTLADMSKVGEVEAVDQQFNRALERSDVGTLRELIGDVYVFTDPTGKISHKQELIDGFASGRIRVKSQTTQDVRIEVYSDTAVETGLLTSMAVRDGHNTSGTFRFTRVWVKNKGRWQTVAFQETAPRAASTASH